MTTYSTSLKLALIGDGQEVGTWGQTTNTNLGTLLEQSIAGTTSINMGDANVTLTSFNGASDQARNQVIVLTGANNAVRDVIPPVVKKTYIIVNNTTGGYAIRVIGTTGTGVNVPNGTTSLIYCNGTNFIEAINSNTITGNSSISGSLAVGGTTTLGAALTYGGVTLANSVTGTGSMVLAASPTFTGVPSAPTAANGTNTTQIATTAFVNAATAAFGTMATQNANNVSITGGSLGNVTLTNATVSSVATAITAAQGGTGLTSSGSSGNVLTSNGSTWVSAAPISALTSGVAQNTNTSAATYTFTGIPATVKRITIMFSGQRTNGSSLPCIRIGTSGGIVSSGYNAIGSSNGLPQTNSTGFILCYDWGSNYSRYGVAVLTLLTGNTWVISGNSGDNNSYGGGSRFFTSSGSLALGGTLDRVQLTTVGGSDVFVDGVVNILYE